MPRHIFTVCPDDSRPGKVRFIDALVRADGKIIQSAAFPCLSFIVDVDCPRDTFAQLCGTPGRPVPTERAITSTELSINNLQE